MSQAARQSLSSPATAAAPIIERLVVTIDAENRDLEQGRRVKYETYSQAKNQSLLELDRLIPALAGAAAARPLRDALTELHAKLEINRRLLAVQLKACEAVAEIITRAVQDGQSDGTYTALAWSRSRA